ncbi:MAG: guanitoxin biosynthesis heme-dependent pre-guanitoxin N-hydroxylase GntA [Flavisolibacter sp.]
MKPSPSEVIIKNYHDYISKKEFPCVAARAAETKQQVHCMVAENMFCPNDDPAILSFLYKFVDLYRLSDTLFHSVAIIFKGPGFGGEELFDKLMWHRLQALSDLDATKYPYDDRVACDPSSPQFSFSLKQEAFFIIGLHHDSSRPSRRFNYPTLVFNPHAQFEDLRKSESYDKLKNIVRKRDVLSSGTVNPMLEDFGNSSEVFQYSGRYYNSEWKCPLKIQHATS